MRKEFLRLFGMLALGVGLVVGMAGCNANSGTSSANEDQAQKTRDEIAKATEEIKPKVEEAGRELNQAAEKAGEQIQAAAQGVKDGLAKGKTNLVDINSATTRQLEAVPGITDREAHKIVQGRPYVTKNELVTKGILSESSYDRVRDELTVDAKSHRKNTE